MKSRNSKIFKFACGLWGVTLVVFFVLCTHSLWMQRQEDQIIKQTATQIVQQANAQTPEEKVTALRNYIRQHVTFRGATKKRESFLRDTAYETLSSGKGYCGENSRLFICMATSVGVPAQRVNLYGTQPHVVAEVQFQPGKSVVVDCQNPGLVPGLTPLDDIIAKGSYGYTDYSTIHLQRFGLYKYFERTQLKIGPLSWWLENPHLIRATIYGVLFIVVLTGGMMVWGCVYIVRYIAEKRISSDYSVSKV